MIRRNAAALEDLIRRHKIDIPIRLIFWNSLHTAKIVEARGRDMSDGGLAVFAGVELRQVISRPGDHDWSGPTGYVQSLLDHVLPDLKLPVALVCGSREMIAQTRDRLQHMGFPAESILTNY